MSQTVSTLHCSNVKFKPVSDRFQLNFQGNMFTKFELMLGFSVNIVSDRPLFTASVFEKYWM